MKCIKCGCENLDGAERCKNCEYPLNKKKHNRKNIKDHDENKKTKFKDYGKGKKTKKWIRQKGKYVWERERREWKNEK